MRLAVLSTAAIGASAAVLTGVRPTNHKFIRSLPSDDVASAVRMRLLGELPISRRSDVAAAESVLGGAVVAAQGVLSATGTFVVPEARQPTKGPTANLPITYAASFWVGIDGVSCNSASLRGGVDIFWDTAGTSYNAWYQLAPGRSVDFAVAVAPGDTVRITAEAAPQAGDAAGSVTIDNLSTGRSATHAFAASEVALCRSEAVWAVHDFVLEVGPGMPVPLVDFDAVAFTDVEALAAGAGGSEPARIDLAGATVLNIDQPAQGGKLTDCAASEDSVKCERTFGGDGD